MEFPGQERAKRFLYNIVLSLCLFFGLSRWLSSQIIRLPDIFLVKGKIQLQECLLFHYRSIQKFCILTESVLCQATEFHGKDEISKERRVISWERQINLAATNFPRNFRFYRFSWKRKNFMRATKFSGSDWNFEAEKFWKRQNCLLARRILGAKDLISSKERHNFLRWTCENVSFQYLSFVVSLVWSL